jgi:hypothetical protein
MHLVLVSSGVTTEVEMATMDGAATLSAEAQFK